MAPAPEAEPSAAASADKRRCVLLLCVDGWRPDCITREAAPTVWGAIHSTPDPSCFPCESAVAYSLASQVGDICWSGPGWTSAATGVWRDKHGVSGNTFPTQQFDKFPSFVARLHAARPEARTAAVVNWKPLSSDILSHCSLHRVHEDDDGGVERSAAELLRGESRLDVLVVHLDKVDAAGHEFDYGPSVKEYMEAVKETDERLARLLRVLRSERAWYGEEEWLVAITTDHGGADYTHEDSRPENRTNFLLLASQRAVGGEILPSPLIVDVAPTVLAFLQVPIASHWHLDGRPVGLQLRGGGGSHWMDLKASQDPLNKFPIPPEELEEEATETQTETVADASQASAEACDTQH